MSHPAWVCGLKQFDEVHKIAIQIVTPCVGVWIETLIGQRYYREEKVTPCVGVWIET